MTFPDIPILNYHKILPSADIGITSRHPQKFENDMKTLFEAGYKAVTFKDILFRDDLPDKPVILTFDDACSSVYQYAFPVMKKFGFKGVVFVLSNYIGRFNDWDVQFGGRKFKHLSLEELKELQENGFETASHGISHQALGAGNNNTEKEIFESKTDLENLLGSEVISFCYPFGRFDDFTVDMVINAGYKFGIASIHYKTSDNNRLFSLRRFNIYAHDSNAVFIKKLNMNFHSFLAYRDFIFQLGGRATIIYQKLNGRVEESKR